MGGLGRIPKDSEYHHHHYHHQLGQERLRLGGEVFFSLFFLAFFFSFFSFFLSFPFRPPPPPLPPRPPTPLIYSLQRLPENSACSNVERDVRIHSLTTADSSPPRPTQTEEKPLFTPPHPPPPPPPSPPSPSPPPYPRPPLRQALANSWRHKGIPLAFLQNLPGPNSL